MRQIFLDTETTGLDPNLGHRIIEIAAIELNDRHQTDKRFHKYINPLREIDSAAQEVHGITLDFLKDKPLFDDIAQEFLDFIKGGELIIHNAPFDLGFLNMELGKINEKSLAHQSVKITDTLKLAKDLRPGQRNNLDALCRAYEVDNSERSLHGALLDAQLLSEVYLAMTRGQEAFKIDFPELTNTVKLKKVNQENLPVIKASVDELKLHGSYFNNIKKKNT
jgi:DNA polymerase-3 subunit epsilon